MEEIKGNRKKIQKNMEKNFMLVTKFRRKSLRKVYDWTIMFQNTFIMYIVVNMTLIDIWEKEKK